MTEKKNVHKAYIRNNLKASCFIIITVSLIFLSFLSFSYAEKRIEDFDIKGFKLDMELEELKNVPPNIQVDENKNYKEEFYPTRFSCGYGKGWGMEYSWKVWDWNIYFEITDEPFGKGVYKIKYQKDLNERVDAKVYVENFRNELIAKYGKPRCEVFSKNGVQPYPYNYIAYWGDRCNNQILIKNSSKLIQGFDDESLDKKYLVAAFNEGYGGQILLTLYDRNPHLIAVNKRKEKEIERARREKGDF
jgi:hypothetical protein